MKEGKSAKSNGLHQNDHLSPFKFAKLLDPEASWDKVLKLLAFFTFFFLQYLFSGMNYSNTSLIIQLISILGNLGEFGFELMNT